MLELLLTVVVIATITAIVTVPAVWSRNPRRREAARQVLAVLLGQRSTGRCEGHACDPSQRASELPQQRGDASDDLSA